MLRYLFPVIIMVSAFCFSACSGEREVSQSDSNKDEKEYNSDDFVRTIPAENQIGNLVDLTDSSASFAEEGYKFLPEMSGHELMDCSINNFIEMRIAMNAAEDGLSEKQINRFAIVDSVFRNAMFAIGYDTEENRQDVYDETILAKLIVTKQGATEVEIMTAKKRVEGACVSSFNEAFGKFEAKEANGAGK